MLQRQATVTEPDEDTVSMGEVEVTMDLTIMQERAKPPKVLLKPSPHSKSLRAENKILE